MIGFVVASLALALLELKDKLRGNRAWDLLLTLLSNPKPAKRRIGKRRCELSLIDFVEVFWMYGDSKGQPFVRTWVQEAICAHLEAVTAGKMTKLLINVPPGFTKSMLVNVFWPAWEWGPKNLPHLRYISWSHNPMLTERDNENCRKIIESPLYQEWWGHRFKMDPTTNAKRFYKNLTGGFRIASSIEGGGTGLRADRLIWDDPHKADDADSTAALENAVKWFARTLPTRVRNAGNAISKIKVPFWVREVHGIPDENELTDENGQKITIDDNAPKAMASATVGIMQRIHLHDISGVILKNPALGYVHLMIEMEFRGDVHPARMLKDLNKSPIDYSDPRYAFEAVAKTIEDIDNGDEWSSFCKQWRWMGLYLGRLADPIRFAPDEVNRIKIQMREAGGNDAIAAQFDQWPVTQNGDWFPSPLSRVIQPQDVPTLIGNAVRGFDFASGSSMKSAQTASVRIRLGTDQRIYIEHSSATRGGPFIVDQYMKRTHKLDPINVMWSIPEDPGSGGKHVVAYHKRENAPGRNVMDSRETGSKLARAKPISGQFAAGNVMIVAHEDMAELLRELEDFPYGDFCDLVDALSRAYDALLMRPSGGEMSGGELIETGDYFP